MAGTRGRMSCDDCAGSVVFDSASVGIIKGSDSIYTEYVFGSTAFAKLPCHTSSPAKAYLTAIVTTLCSLWDSRLVHHDAYHSAELRVFR